MKRTLLLFLAGTATYLTFSGNAAGPSGTPNGVQTAKTGCGGLGCHGSMGSDANMTLTLIEGTTPVTDGKYKPGGQYSISFSQSTPSASKYGFIMLVTDDATDKQAGTLAKLNAGALYKITNKSGYKVAEQPTPLPPIAGGIGMAIDWTAPAKGTGDVTIYLAVNSCNGNGNADAGDTYALKKLKLSEGFPVSVEDISNIKDIQVYPNPATDILHITGQESVDGYNYAVYNINGVITMWGQLHGNSIDVSALPTGTHILRLSDGSISKTISFVK